VAQKEDVSLLGFPKEQAEALSLAPSITSTRIHSQDTINHTTEANLILP